MTAHIVNLMVVDNGDQYSQTSIIDMLHEHILGDQLAVKNPRITKTINPRTALTGVVEYMAPILVHINDGEIEKVTVDGEGLEVDINACLDDPLVRVAESTTWPDEITWEAL